ncbi:hypothetical protein K503DRAFT_520502 [Rhizopogon vinicolor AM-OR11-026]|uniref:Uncharacterized protein n=1 Tax=Rhizopogon vinicolor AM-OR11-026 TaxID=1314800 RepID=A0A1B7N8V6_9AGAM|nr:hypothetical protein K503DRAFT_520502 [Rhizopogon vinicolor AM-OR11-026]
MDAMHKILIYDRRFPAIHASLIMGSTRFHPHGRCKSCVYCCAIFLVLVLSGPLDTLHELPLGTGSRVRDTQSSPLCKQRPLPIWKIPSVFTAASGHK